MADLPINGVQLANANTIIGVGKQRGMSNRDIITALTVALAESSLLNQANSNVPESLSIPHEKVGDDHKSVGVFQQQVGIWGTAVELMDVRTSANKFYDALSKVPNRDALPIPAVAQQVQQSAFSDGSNYAKQLELAEQINGSTSGDQYTQGSKTVGNNDPLKWIMDSGNQKRIGLFILGAVIIIFAIVKLVSGTDIAKAAVKVAL